MRLSAALPAGSPRLSWLPASLFLISLATIMPPPVAQAQLTNYGPAVALAGGFKSPYGVAVDKNGNVFVADTGQNAIKEILAVNGKTPSSPTVKTVSTAFKAPRGIAVDVSGNVFLTGSWNGANPGVSEILAVNGVIPSSPAIKALGSGFSDPYGVAVDSFGDVFVADTGNGAVKEILALRNATVIPLSPSLRTLATGFDSPVSVAVDDSGNVFVANFGTDQNGSVEEIQAVDGSVPESPTVVTLAGSYGFLSPAGVALDSSGNVFVSDEKGNALFEIVAVGGFATVNLLASVAGAQGVAVDVTGNVFAASNSEGSVVELPRILIPGGVTPGSISLNLGSQAVGSPGAAQALSFSISAGTQVSSIAILTTGIPDLDFTDAGAGTCTARIYATATTCKVTVKFTPLAAGLRRGAVVFYDGPSNVLATTPIYGTGTGPQATFQPGSASAVAGGLGTVSGVAVDAAGNIFAVVFQNQDGSVGIFEILAKGGYTTVRNLSSRFAAPFGVAVDGSGNVFVADALSNAVKELVAASGYTTVKTLGSGFYEPEGVALDGSGNVFVGDSGNARVKEILAEGGYTTVKTLAPDFTFGFPQGIAVDAGDNVFVADSSSYYKSVYEIHARGGYTSANTVGGVFDSPIGVALDAGGDVYVADYGDGMVKEILAQDGYKTVNTLSTAFVSPEGLALDGSGNVFVADSSTGQVGRLDLATPPSLSFSTSTPVGSIDTADGPQTVSIWNIGNQPLIFAEPKTGSNPSYPESFPENTHVNHLCDIDNPLEAGASCDVSVDFAPKGAGANSGSVVLTDNILNRVNATQEIALGGMGLGVPKLSWPEPASITYGTALSSTQLDATASVAGTFTYSPATGTVLPGGRQRLSATFTPRAADYITASATVNLTVNLASQLIVFAAVPTQTEGTDVNLSVKSSSALPVVLTSLTPTICQLSGTWASSIAAGDCAIVASQSGNNDYLSATTVRQTFEVAPSTQTSHQTITFAPIATQTAAKTITLQATASSALAVSFQSATPAVCTVTGKTASLIAYGFCQIQAWQGGNSKYFAAPTVTREFGVSHATQQIDFPAIPTQVAGGTVQLTATASSGLPVTFASKKPSVCTVSGTTATLLAYGFCAIEATQAGNETYLPVETSQEFGVAHARKDAPIPSAAK
jgi:DNA-binding beta-propeller fold protein YncE